jgi:hypothetical protein
LRKLCSGRSWLLSVDAAVLIVRFKIDERYGFEGGLEPAYTASLLKPLPDLLEVEEVGVGVDALLLGSSHHGHLIRRRLDLPHCA